MINRASGGTVVFASCLGLGLGTLYVYSLGLLIAPIQAEFGWSRAAIASGLTIVSVVTVIASPFIGGLIDRLGARRIAIAGVSIYSVAMMLLVTAGPSIWTWWGGWLLVAMGSVLIKPTVWSAAIVSRFERRRGIALALALCGSGIASMIGPPLLNALMEQHEWRAVYLAIGIFGLAVVLPILWLCFFDARDLKRVGRTEQRTVAKPDVGLTLREGFRSRAFIHMALCGYLATAAGTALLVHFVPIVTAAGLDRGMATVAAGAFGVASIAARIIAGFALDWLDGRIVGGIAFAVPALAPMLLLGYDGSMINAVIIAALIGFAIGSEIDVLAFLSSQHFGLRNYGSLWGTIVGLIALGSGTGPLIAGLIFDNSGGYVLAFYLAAPAMIICAILIATLGRSKVAGVAHH